jgi:hypothetical protein
MIHAPDTPSCSTHKDSYKAISYHYSLHLRFNPFLIVTYNTLKATDFNANSSQVLAKKELAIEVLYLVYDYSLSVTDDVS